MPRLFTIALVLVCVLCVSSLEASAAVTRETVRGRGSGWTRAGYYCDFTLRHSERSVGRYTFVRHDGHIVRFIDHEVRRGTYTNPSTGASVRTLSRYTITSRSSTEPFRLSGAFMQIRAADGTLLMSSAGSALIQDIRDHYVYLQRTKHATMVPQFTGIPGICEMLGGHQVVD